jgi:phosphoribosylformylglycinamidine cyclo-ligase
MLQGPKTVRAGDLVLGIASSGLHTNGYSLARKIFFDRMKLKPASHIAELGNSIGAELLKVHVSYGPLIQKLLKKFNGRDGILPSPIPSPSTHRRSQAIRAFAHITGGGFIDNLPRVLPKNCDALIRRGSWELLPIFEMIRAKSAVPEPELYQVFNMGIGMTAIVSSDQAGDVLTFIRAQKQKAWIIGEVVKGKGTARVQ